MLTSRLGSTGPLRLGSTGPLRLGSTGQLRLGSTGPLRVAPALRYRAACHLTLPCIWNACFVSQRHTHDGLAHYNSL
eukprot:159914-Chlamydomonas_euryale.AAC.2